MADTKAEKILANIETTLETITVVNGYNNTVKIVTRNTKAVLNMPMFPAIIIGKGSGTVDAMAKSSAHRKMFITIEAWTRKEKDASQEVEKFLGDIQKAMMVDPRRGGNAINTIEVSDTPILIDSETAEIGFQVQYQIDYRTKIEDPTAAP